MKQPQRSRLLALAAPALILAPFATRAESPWPASPIRLVVPFPPGGSSDILGRLIADRLSKDLHANIFVDNRPGATTQIGTEHVAGAAPDGNTLLLAAASSFTVLPNLRKLSYSLQSFESAGGIADYIAVMAARKTLPVTTLQQFVDHARQQSNPLSFGSAGEASQGHLYGMTLARDTSIQVQHVPYRGSAAAVNGLLAGEIDFIIDGAVTPMVKADKVQPLAVFYKRRHVELPDVPTVLEAGFRIKSTKGAGWGLLAPKGTPRPIMDRLAQSLQKVLEQRDVQDALARANSTAAWQAPQEFVQNIDADRRLYAELLPAMGIKEN
ncbi:tripartite tricarboxylate transporter substrate binding protein [Diaphorobacter ruginosibacter]|uniref:Tripartite tricarboxylate transporter substrate binding protein n=1 Tax=Diaphorobacter ruginosibacter TaxID=1715720 RepID=A0A7G9RRJ8_9BURK|nr:tripartite tricarboxylate transporter substrate binding protein [Diaphorobacter ruginosibacter]QNN58223.1 tripartite tricarboxylate transporter substrate binding protein [Diaphorobacter ruginosibacter]